MDLGTGSGAIALSLAVEGGLMAPGLVVWATDASADALAVAEENLAELAGKDPVAAGRVRLSEGRWFDALPPELVGTVDLVVSNPPYVAESDFPGLDPTVRDWEPRRALVAATGSSGVGGMADIEAVIAGAARWLRPSGVLVVEIDPSQGTAAVEVARRSGFGRSRTRRDLAGRIRMVVARAVTVGLEPLLADPESLALAAEALRTGAVVAIPTDTVYGLAADPEAAAGGGAALRPQGAAVGRGPPGAGGRSGADRRGGRPLGGPAERLADRYWPGPLTLVVPRRRSFTADLGGPPSARADGRGAVAGPSGGPGPVPGVGADGRDQRQSTRRPSGHPGRGGGSGSSPVSTS